MFAIILSFYYLFPNLNKFSSYYDPNAFASWAQSSWGLEISRIFYADDCLLVDQAFLKDAIAQLAILNAYTTYSDQSINSTKSYIIFSSNTDRRVKHQIKKLLHIAEKRMNWQYSLQEKRFLAIKLFTMDKIFIVNSNVNDGKKFSSIIKKYL